jgi:hypothetical protein
MTDRPPSSFDDEAPPSSRDALISLHARTNTFQGLDPGLIPGFRMPATGAALRALAAAPEEEVSVPARLNVLAQLARAGFPDYETEADSYRELAASVATRRGLDPDRLLDDLKRSANERVPFRLTANGSQLPHDEAAFIGEQICSVRRVETGGLAATWIFSEFETDAPFEGVVDWIDPRSWPRRGPMMFKRMELVEGGQPVALGSPGDPHWHGVFHEEVQLVQRVNTLLHCDFWRDGNRAAGLTYDLSLSLDNQIDVDRGFLLVNDVGPVRRVKALKIVGFTDDVWDTVASMVCPFWTDFVRGAVEGGSNSSSVPAPQDPSSMDGSPRTPWSDGFEAWVDFFGDSARAYVELFEDVTARVASQRYSTAAYLDDQRRLWSRLAKDWAQAWTYGLDTIDEVSREGLDAGFTPPGTPREQGRGAVRTMTAPSATQARGEGTVIPVAWLGAADTPVVSDLRSIEAGSALIPASAIVTTVEPLGDQGFGVRLHTTDASAPPGLYVGEVKSADGRNLAPVQLYVSRATGA